MKGRSRAENLLTRAAHYRKAAAQARRRDQLICIRAIAAHLEEEARELDQLLSHVDASHSPVHLPETNRCDQRSAGNSPS